MNKCCNCEKEIDIDGDYGWSNTKDDYLCLECRDSDESSLSTVYVANGDWVDKYFVGEHIRINEEGGDIKDSGLTVNREWVSTDAYRGHYNTTIDGWTEVLSGWTTGAWGDATSDRKKAFNEWAEEIILCKIYPPAPIAIVVDPTSNLFSTGISVLTKYVQIFNEWIEENHQVLSKSLS